MMPRPQHSPAFRREQSSAPPKAISGHAAYTESLTRHGEGRGIPSGKSPEAQLETVPAEKSPAHRALASDPSPFLPDHRLLDIPEIARLLGVSIKTVRRLITRGELPVHRIGRLIRVSKADFEMYIVARRQG